MSIIELQPIPEKVRRRVSTERFGAKRDRMSRAIGLRTIVVFPGDNIQKALDDLSGGDFGGIVILRAGTHFVTTNLTGYSKVNLMGEGRDQTIIDFGSNAVGLSYKGTSGDILENFKLEGFTLQNSNATAGIDIDYADFWNIENVRVTSCDQIGLRIQHSKHFQVSNFRSDNNTGDGIKVIGDVGLPVLTLYFVFNNCLSDLNGGKGFNLGMKNTSQSLLNNCTADTNTGKGFDITESSCRAVKFLGCVATTNGAPGFEVTGTNNILLGCYAEFNTSYDWNILGKDNVILGGDLSSGTAFQNDGGFYDYNIRQFRSDRKNTLYVKNTSGGTLNAGDVVIAKSVANGYEITTTTTQGDDKVIGVVLETISNDGFGNISTEGVVHTLKVDGTTDIAIGDFLGTFTTAKIAMKASAGDMCFAQALEAYTTDDSNGVIDALLFSPRLI